MCNGLKQCHQRHLCHQDGPSSCDSVILRHCRCSDCNRWDKRNGVCHELGYRRYVSREEYAAAMQKFWTDLGMIRVDEWHYCAMYDGPQVSKDVWVWPKTMQSDETK